MSLDTYLSQLPGRCPNGYNHERQPGLCACPGFIAAAEAMSATLAAHPDESARVEQVVRQLAATGKPFSANDARDLHGVRGGVVGATFGRLRSAGVIRPVGEESSTDAGTHGKRVALWTGAAA